MASSFTADVGRIARTVPRAALSLPRALTGGLNRRRALIAPFQTVTARHRVPFGGIEAYRRW